MSQPSRLSRAVDRLFGRQRRLNHANSVLLTFDDGPHPDVTPAVLERLRRYGAKAVFFVVGNRIDMAPHMLSQILEEGHEIGNHTYEHRLDRDPWLLRYFLDVRRCQKRLREMTGRAPSLFRAPEGRISLGSLLTPRMLGLRQMLWSLDSNDWRLRSEAAAKECGERLCAAVKPGDIVLLHDNNPWTPMVLDRLLPHLAARQVNLHPAHNILRPARAGVTVDA